MKSILRAVRRFPVYLSSTLVTFAVLTATQTALAQGVFINEIHYDNASTDTGEAIEIAGPAGTDLSGWEVVLYNGSNGSVYNTIALSGTLTDIDSGFGMFVINLPTNGLQNGSPDGIALINNGSVEQFLSYEGSFVANGGPADSMSSTDIGVSEASLPGLRLSPARSARRTPDRVLPAQPRHLSMSSTTTTAALTLASSSRSLATPGST